MVNRGKSSPPTSRREWGYRSLSPFFLLPCENRGKRRGLVTMRLEVNRGEKNCEGHLTSLEETDC